MKERTLGEAATCHCLLVVHAERGKLVLRRPLRAVADARVNARRDIAIVFWGVREYDSIGIREKPRIR